MIIRATQRNRHFSWNVGRLVVGLMVLITTAPGLAAQESVQPNGSAAVRVFLDCGYRCDFNYLRTEIPFVNYVRDRLDAQVHVLVTRENTGSGGSAVTLDFVGQEAFAGIDNRLVYFTSQDDTNDDERRAMVQRLRLGLVRYAASTALVDDLDVMHAVAEERPQLNAKSADDPWNFWVYRVDFDTEVSEEKREKTKEFGGSFSANRTTDVWKIRLGFNVDYQEESFDLSDATTFTNIRRNNALDVRVIKSLGDHFGFGFGGSAVTTTFRNQDLTARVAPAIDYNFYPYSESTRRQFTVRYTAGINQFNYKELTIFDRISERRANHSVVVSFDRNEPWGSSELAFETSQFLDDLERYRLVFFGELDLRLFRGFSLSLDGDASVIRDQLFLPRRGATNEEILVRRRRLATDYEWQFEIGITYTFGSIYNNVVNSRFAGSSGGFVRAY